MYRSTLTSRKQSIDAAVFAEAPKLYYNYCTAAQQDAHNLAIWDQYISYTPKQIYDLITGPYGIEGMEVGVNVDDEGIFRYKISKNEITPFKADAVFALGDERKVSDNEINVDQTAQGQGIGKAWLKSMVELSAAFGFEQFNFAAGLNNGGYSWAKAGAYLDRDRSRVYDLEQRLSFLQETITARLETVKPYINKWDCTRAEIYARLVNADDLVRISNMGSITVPKEALDSAETILQHAFSSMDAFNKPDVRVSDQMSKLKSVFHGAANGSEEVSLSRYLLAGTSWMGVVDFKNKTQMKYIEDYVGPWKTIKNEAGSVPASGSRLAFAPSY